MKGLGEGCYPGLPGLPQPLRYKDLGGSGMVPESQVNRYKVKNCLLFLCIELLTWACKNV